MQAVQWQCSEMLCAGPYYNLWRGLCFSISLWGADEMIIKSTLPKACTPKFTLHAGLKLDLLNWWSPAAWVTSPATNDHLNRGAWGKGSPRGQQTSQAQPSTGHHRAWMHTWFSSLHIIHKTKQRVLSGTEVSVPQERNIAWPMPAIPLVKQAG